MEPDPQGRIAITRITRRPEIAWHGPSPAPDRLAHLHHEAHEACYIANSVTAEVVVEG